MNNPASKHKLRSWLIIFGSWTLAGILYTTQSYYYRTNIGENVIWLELFIKELPLFYIWAIFTPFLIWLCSTFRIDKIKWLKNSLLHFCFAILLGFTVRGLYNITLYYIEQPITQPLNWDRIFIYTIAQFDYDILIYFVVILIIHAINYYQILQEEKLKSAKLKSALLSSQLETLKIQLQPHFLFNTLNTISVLVKEDVSKAGETIELLGDLLRNTLRKTNTQFHSVKDELDFIKDYLKIEEIRFGERLKVTYNTDDKARSAKIPSLLLLPLVENAIKHGISKKKNSGILIISIEVNNNRVEIIIEDDGPGIGNDPLNSKNLGIGLNITIKRLESIYNSFYQLSLVKSNPTGAIVTLSYPYEKCEIL